MSDARPDSGTGAAGRHAGVAVVASERDRLKAFRRARRHTWLVRAFRLLLPCVALVALGAYGVALVASSRLKGRDFKVESVRIDPTNLTMDNPRYEGFAKDGGQYKVHARTAVTDLKMSGPVQLKEIDGQLIQPTGVVTYVKARSGSFDQKKDLLELYERIDVDGSTGMKARLTRATIFTKDNRITTNEPMYAETATGNIRANNMSFNSQTRQATFREAVEVTLKGNPPTPEAAAQKALKRDTALPGLQPNSGEPVVVRSARLDVDDNARTALFRDDVVARQGEAVLEAPELDVLYEGKATAEGPQPKAAPREGDAAAPAEEATRLKTIKARGGVVMTSKADRVEAQTFDYDAAAERADLAGNVVMIQQPERRVTAQAASLDQKADTALLTGDVVITQGRNVMRAGHVMIDRKAGTAKLRTPAAAKQPAGRISTLFYQNAADKPGAEPKPVRAAPSEPASPLGPLGAGFKSDPDAPIEVEAATLDVNDRKHTAIYTGNVVAKQGDFIVRTEAMTAHYSGETGLTASAPGQPPPAKPKPAAGAAVAGGAGNAELKRIEARNGVVVTGKDEQQATGDWANFDVKANIIVMGGNVVVSQGKQIVRAPQGKRLVMNLQTGLTTFEDEPGAGPDKSGPQVSGAFATTVAPTGGAGVAIPDAKGGSSTCPPGAICRSGRLEAIFYPGQLKEQAKEKAKAAKSAVPKEVLDKGAEAARDAASTLKRGKVPDISAWGTTTREPGSR